MDWTTKIYNGVNSKKKSLSMFYNYLNITTLLVYVRTAILICSVMLASIFTQEFSLMNLLALEPAVQCPWSTGCPKKPF